MLGPDLPAGPESHERGSNRVRRPRCWCASPPGCTPRSAAWSARTRWPNKDVAMLTALSTPGAIDLLRAYSQASPKGRKTILTVAKTLVQTGPNGGRGLRIHLDAVIPDKRAAPIETDALELGASGGPGSAAPSGLVRGRRTEMRTAQLSATAPPPGVRYP